MILEELSHLTEEWKDEVEKIRNMNSVVLFGAGKTSEFIVNEMNKMEIFPIAFCDNDTNKAGEIIAGIPVISVETLQQKYRDSYIYITTQLYYSVIRKQLIELGINSDNISEYDLIFQMQWEREYWQYCLDRADELDELFQCLADEKSKKILYNRLAFFKTRKRKYMTEIRDYCQYFDEKLVNFQEISNYVDLGMYKADTILSFLRVGDKKHCEIWGFEPDHAIASEARELLNSVEGECKIHVVEKGTSDRNEIVSVRNSLGIMQTIVDDVWDDDEKSEKQFEVCTLDTFFAEREHRLDFIKMDIEGAEYQTLLGSKKVLLEDVPVLAICVYHKKEDLFTITQFIQSLNRGYQLYLRHYSDNQTETVLYAVPKEEYENK